MCDQVFSKCLVGEQKEWGELGPSTTSTECLQSLQEAFALSYLEPTDSNSIVCPLQFHHCTFINTWPLPPELGTVSSFESPVI